MNGRRRRRPDRHFPDFKARAPATAVQFTARASAGEFTAPASAVQFTAPVPAVQFTAPASAVQFTAPAPAVQFTAPASAVQGLGLPRILLPLVLLFLLATAITCEAHGTSHYGGGGGPSPEYIDYSSATKYCYSCMSEDFLSHWQYLEEVYYRPVNFTDHCFAFSSQLRVSSSTSAVQIGVHPCHSSLCVAVIEPRILAGQHIGNNIIRGCFSSIFRYGGQRLPAQSHPLEHVADTSCTRVPARLLLPPHLAARSSNRTIEMCWCSGQLCNDYPSVPINEAALSLLPHFLQATLIALIASCFC